MDSFFSLFDPSDGTQNKQKNKKWHKPESDNVKKKTDTPKGRRKGRKSNGKHETLPEESSFLCEPNLSTELLVKDVSYIENYIEVNRREDDSKNDDKKSKRRNSGRKTRRKRHKLSPPLDSTNVNNDKSSECHADGDNLNNQKQKPKVSDDTIGKNVNDLTKMDDDYKKNKRKGGDDDRSADFKSREVYNVIDRLEKVSLKDDMYLAGDFNTEDLESDFFYCSDDMTDCGDDSSTSEGEESSEEAYGYLPPEPRFGNVEYKLQLVQLCERRFQHLVTQMKWRLRSGGGSCVYVVGVRDCGALVGLRARALRGSLAALRRMARALHARLAHVTARRVAPHRAVAEAHVRMLADPQQSVELRVAVMGANEAGKSTLIGVLTQGELDNGRGSARLNMFRHLHEVKSGRTSSLSHEILGFDAQGNVVNYGCSELMTAERIGERSAKLVSFLDLAGHSKYQRTTLHGLTGYCPHYAMLVISATAGMTAMTEQHLALVLALGTPLCAVVSKCELAPTAPRALLPRLARLLHNYNKKPLLITDENMARNCVAPRKLILDAINDQMQEEEPMEIIPVFPVSCVRGIGLNALHAYLLAIQPPLDDVQPKPEDETCEFQIDEIFHVGESGGPVVGGLLAAGQLYEGDHLVMGPLEDGSFTPVKVRSIYRNRIPVAYARAGHCCSVGLVGAGGGGGTPGGGGAGTPGGGGVGTPGGAACARAGMVLLSVPQRAAGVGGGGAGGRQTFGGCPPGKCKRAAISSLVHDRQQSLNDAKKRKNKVKNKNLLQELANAEEGLSKTIPDVENNIYSTESDSDAEKEGCTCGDKVYLEDPNDPRGCIFFQASVHLLQHSTAIYPGFQCTVHVGNVRQTAIIEGIMSRDGVVRAGGAASLVFRFVRCPEYVARGRRLLFTAGLGTRAIGRVTQVFPYIP